MFHSSNLSPVGGNRINYENHEVDLLLEEGRLTMSPTRRKEIYSNVQKLISDDLPYINLWHSVNIALIRKNIEGFILYPDEDMISLKDVYFTENSYNSPSGFLKKIK
jgi:peptide/nickel transport system substrate-binding protein